MSNTETSLGVGEPQFDVQLFRTLSLLKTACDLPLAILHVARFGRFRRPCIRPRKEEAAMINEANGDPIEDRILLQQHRPASSRRTILRKTLTVLTSSVVVGAVAIASDAAVAFGPPPPPPGLAGPPHGLAGPPPGLGGLPRPGVGGPPHAGPAGPRGLSHLGDTPGLRGGGRALQGQLQGRSASNGYGRTAGNSYGRSAGYSYGRNGGRNRSYGVYVDGNYDSSYADDGCYYTYSSRRRSRVCSED
jgi:hypothetical protein